MRKLVAVALLPLLSLTGCTVGPKYNRPTFQPPAIFYSEDQARQISIADYAWGDLFKDPVLQTLIHEALRNNYDLQLALSRAEQERALAAVAPSPTFPQEGSVRHIPIHDRPTF